MKTTQLSTVIFDVGTTLGVVEYQLRLTLYPDTKGLLTTFQSLGLTMGAVATVPGSVRENDVRAMLDEAGIGSFFGARSITTSSEGGRGEPAPCIYESAARKLGCEPVACVYVARDELDLRFARAAGMHGIIRSWR